MNVCHQCEEWARNFVAANLHALLRPEQAGVNRSKSQMKMLMGIFLVLTRRTKSLRRWKWCLGWLTLCKQAKSTSITRSCTDCIPSRAWTRSPRVPRRKRWPSTPYQWFRLSLVKWKHARRRSWNMSADSSSQKLDSVNYAQGNSGWRFLCWPFAFGPVFTRTILGSGYFCKP